MNSIFTRRSIRRYSDTPIETEKIDKILRAAMQAPSAGNQQPWEFIIVNEKTQLETLSKLSPYASMVSKSPVSLVILANTSSLRFADYWQQDLSAATQNILIEATELGLGSVWLGVAPDKDRIDYVSNMFNLPSNIIPFAVVALGYPATQGNTFVDRYDESKIHYEKY